MGVVIFSVSDATCVVGPWRADIGSVFGTRRPACWGGSWQSDCVLGRDASIIGC